MPANGRPPEYDEQRLVELVRETALEFGDFVLASGARASYYLDCRKLTMDSRGINQVAAGIWQRLSTDVPASIGGMAVGAVPLVAAVLAHADWHGASLRGFFVRKEAKTHGTRKQLEGVIQLGTRAVILEDVVTSGGSCLAAVEAARAAGLVVERAIAIIDRRPGDHPEFASAGVHLDALLDVRRLGLEP